MISEFRVNNFKRFDHQAFRLGALSILTGLNGSGKTSMIHGLLLAWEASHSKSSNVIRLNGPFGIELGTAEDIRNCKSENAPEFHLTSTSGPDALWTFKMSSDEALYILTDKKPEVLPPAFSGKPRSFCYLCAERLGPRSVLSSSPFPPERLEVGVRGEQCAQILGEVGNKLLEYPERLHPDREENSTALLKYEVEHWLSEIARPIEIDAEKFPGTSVTALRFRAPGGTWVRAPNMGFGVSYALPVILAGLIAADGGLLIVESPEAHLHPAGQSRMGVFLAWLAGRGVQVLIETHSDHLLNGVRRAIGEQKYLDHDQAIVHFFESDNDDVSVQQLGFTAIGGVSKWPSGFFDQYQIDVTSLGRIRRRS